MSSTELNGTAAAWLTAARTAAAEIARLSEIRDRALEHVKEALGDHETGTLAGKPVVTWAWSRPARRLDRKKLEEAYGKDVIDGYLVDARPARPLRILDGEQSPRATATATRSASPSGAASPTSPPAPTRSCTGRPADG
jgi:hypothetical protein